MAEDRRHETEAERLDRNLLELLNEVRVALPGVQVLFAFLLAVPFQQRFADTTSFQRDTYFVALALSLLATALLIAPTALHRLNFRARDKKAIVFYSNRLVIAGIGVLAFAMTAVMVLIADFIFSTQMAIATGAGSGLVFLLLWLALPISRWRHQ